MIIQQENAMHTNLIIIGSGGHGKVVADVLVRSDTNSFSMTDSSPIKVGCIIQNKKVSLLRGVANFESFHIAIGANQVRYDLYVKYSLDADFISVISPDSYVASTAIVMNGVFIAAMSVVSVDAHIGFGCIINHGAIVEHDCLVGDFCHIAPNATLLGGVSLGKRVFVGAGAIILPGVRIADDVVIGAGAVVIKDVISQCTVVGLPAKKI
jgi:sugar O-acyltransferase (sialic acid O-acetyltransferase NeuD family)